MRALTGSCKVKIVCCVGSDILDEICSVIDKAIKLLNLKILDGRAVNVVDPRKLARSNILNSAGMNDPSIKGTIIICDWKYLQKLGSKEERIKFLRELRHSPTAGLILVINFSKDDFGSLLQLGLTLPFDFSEKYLIELLRRNFF